LRTQLIRKKTLEKLTEIGIKRNLGKKPDWRLKLVSASFTIIKPKTLTNAFAIVRPYLTYNRDSGDDQWTGIELYQNVETRSQGFTISEGTIASIRKITTRLGLVALVIIIAVAMFSRVAEAGQTRALKIYHLHTHERATIVFKRNGRYDPAGLKKLNYILRDWRQNEPTRMDPRLYDLIWEVYQKSGSHDYINVVCGYRAPETNSMLRSRTRGVAEKSQHMLGKALDFYLPDVRLAKLREIGIKFQVGGVGFYPTSGSPFVHMDVGGVRAWPRMPRRELARLFPDGRTLHKPAEGGVMPGYAAALADYKRRVDTDSIQVAGTPSSNSDNDNGTRHKSLLAALFSGGDETSDDVADAENVESAPVKPDRRRNTKVVEQPQDVVIASAEDDSKAEQAINAPVPKVRPAYASDDQMTLETALLGTRKNAADEAMQAALTPQPADAANVADATQPEFADLKSYHVPVPQLLGNRKQVGDSQDEVLTASLDAQDAATLATVPVPDVRPEEVAVEVKKADLAKAADRTTTATTHDSADDITVTAPDIKPSEIAALAAQTSSAAQGDDSTDEDEDEALADSLDAPDSKNQGNLAEMASLDPKDIKTATRSFVLHADTAAALNDAAEVTSKVTKGSRARTAEQLADDKANAARKLTQNMIAQWAMSKARAEGKLAQPGKMDRVAIRQVQDADASAPNTVKIDLGRFAN
jgi:uncharacterized protein YcbK (DUF882 family)